MAIFPEGNFDLTVIMPALNEEKNITPAVNNTLKAFDDYGIAGEIIVVNDGSKDGTRQIVEGIQAEDKRIRLINHEFPRGIGNSYWEGVDKSRSAIVTWVPGDNENDPWEILRYYKLMEQVDIVIPFIFNKEARSVFRNALSYFYRFIINTTFGVNFNYTNGTVLFRKSLLNELKTRSYGFFFQTDILIRTVKKGYLFAEVPYRLGLRKEGISKAISFPSLLNVMKGYLRLVSDYYFNQQKGKDKGFACGSMTAKRRDKKEIKQGMPDYKVALIVLYDSEYRFLLQHRTKDARLLADHWAFFGGGIKPAETPLEALGREAMEELGHKVENPRLVLEQAFQEGNTEGYMYVYAEQFAKDKSLLRLNEGQGWGWYKESELDGLKMIPRDKQTINLIAKRLRDAFPK